MSAPMVYQLKKPSLVMPKQKYPALILMHGRGSNESNMFDLVEGLEEHFFIFSIRGHIPHPPGFSFFTFKVYGYPDRDVFDEGIQLITDFIDYAAERYPIDTDSLYLLGFSQGAVTANTLALTLGERVKGIVSLSGYIPEFVKEEYEKKPVDQLSVFLSHGVDDPVLPYEWGEAAKEYFEKAGANVSFHSYESAHTVLYENKQDLQQWLLNEVKK